MTQKIKLSGDSDCCSDDCCSLDASPKQEIKEKIKERYGKIALSGNSESCCMPKNVVVQILHLRRHYCQLVMIKMNWNLYLNHLYLEWVVELHLNFANLKEGETVVDLGSGAGIDAFLASKSVKD